MAEKKLKVGIIGTGQATSISKGHFNGYMKSGKTELIGVYDLNKEAAIRWCDEMGVDSSLCYDDPDKLIKDADALSICTPNFTHTEYVCKCLEYGTNVFCEKPVCSTGEDIAKIRKAMNDSEALGGVNMSYRYVPGFRMIHDIVQSGRYGKLYTLRHNMGGSRLANEAIPLEWRFVRGLSGTGALGDFGSHALDLLRFIVGENKSFLEETHIIENTFIKSRMYKGEPKDVENDDCSMIIARLSCGALYSLLLSRVGSLSSTMEVVLERAMLRFCFDVPDRIEIQTRSEKEGYGLAEIITVQGVRPEWHEAGPSDIPYLACEESTEAFIKSIANGEKPEVDLEYGLSIMEQIEELDRSANEVG